MKKPTTIVFSLPATLGTAQFPIELPLSMMNGRLNEDRVEGQTRNLDTKIH